MFSRFFHRVYIPIKGFNRFILIVLVTAIIVPVIEGSSPREGYDAKTGKWINKKAFRLKGFFLI